MPDYRYLIVGGGMTADAAVRGIRELDPAGAIGLISAEQDAPYARPPLSKGLWKGEREDSVALKTSDRAVALHLGRKVTRLDTAGRKVVDDQGTSYGYGKLLLATGGTPRRLPYGEGVIYFRTLEDYRRLRALAAPGREVAVIGGGFIGSEIAAALTMQGCKVTMLFPESGIGSRVFPADLAANVVEYYRAKGVDVRTGASVTGMRQEGGRSVVESSLGPVTADVVVAGLSVVPNSELATGARIAVNDGIIVDERLRTSEPDVYAAGDVARFSNPALGAMRVEHEDNAVTMGKAAGRAMAGDLAPYQHIPFFYSDLFELGYEAVGDVDRRNQTVAEWKVPFREGVIYYLKDELVRGVLLWNVWGQVDAARALIGKPLTAKLAL